LQFNLHSLFDTPFVIKAVAEDPSPQKKAVAEDPCVVLDHLKGFAGWEGLQGGRRGGGFTHLPRVTLPMQTDRQTMYLQAGKACASLLYSVDFFSREYTLKGVLII
jgi:hypothetical protein